MKNQVGSTRIDTVLKMLAISFVSLFAFCTGVFIGKQMSDSDYQLKALESDFTHGGKQAAAHGEHPEDEIADEEVAALTEKYVNSEKDGDDHGTAEEHGDAHGKTAKAEGKESHVAQVPHMATKKEENRKVASTEEHDESGDEHEAAGHGKPSAKPDLSAAHKAATRVANNAVPTEPVTAPAKGHGEKARVPSSLPKTVGASQDVEFTVQVASYPTSEAAKEHATELVKKGFPAFPVEATIGGRTWFRVSVGSFKTAKEATSYRAQLLKQAELQSAIVQRIQR
jgi:cell division protein FtsN